MSEISTNHPSKASGGEQSPPFESVDVTASPRDEFVVNYFNYYTEVEDHFVRRRGKHLYISSLDWAIIESWKDLGIPLHIVLRGIDRVFDSYETSPRAVSGKLINSILYCQQEVLACFEEYKHARVGANASPSTERAGDGPPPFSKEVLLEYLNGRGGMVDEFAASLDQEKARMMGETLDRGKERLQQIIREVQSAESLNLEALEQELTRLERLMYESLIQSVPSSEMETLRQEGKRHLRLYKKQMSKDIYQQTLDHYVAKRLREAYQLPRLSLFYM